MKELPGVSQVCQSQGVIPGKTSCLTHLREGCRTCSMSSTELRLAQGPEPDPWWAAEWDHLLGLPGAEHQVGGMCSWTRTRQAG